VPFAQLRLLGKNDVSLEILMTRFCLFCFLAVLAQLPSGSAIDVEPLFRNGRTWEQFLSGISAQREVWLKTESDASVPPEFIDRANGVSTALSIIVVAEDWCPDSAHTVPYVARLARSAGIPLRVVDSKTGAALTAAHRTPDGRTATPTVVLLRNGRDIGAWVERPAALQNMFLSMSTNPENAKRFSQRSTWYESDRGLSALREIVALIEETRDKG
jgi:hypothetical protein